mgnify:CR=1 FL=1
MINKLLEIFSTRELNLVIAFLAVGIFLTFFSSPYALAYVVITGVAYANYI